MTPRQADVRLLLPRSNALIKSLMAVKRVGILYHPMNQAAGALAEEIEAFLRSRTASVWRCSAWEEETARAEAAGTDLMLTIGGDGTILRAVQVAYQYGIPVTGINLGKLGFMTELAAGEALARLPALLGGEGWIDQRAMLEVAVEDGAGGLPRTFYALNDAVVARGAIARVVYVETRVDNELLTTYKADGVIVATATGSTGYSLAAGGPILHPGLRDFLLVPILPHLSPAYPLVFPPDTVVRLVITTLNPATLSVDGHINLPLDTGSVVTVRRSASTARFLRIHPESSFYGSLERKLKGGKPVDGGR